MSPPGSNEAGRLVAGGHTAVLPAGAGSLGDAVRGLVTLRQLASHDDYRACFELQLATWGRAFEEAVPPSVLKISQRVGGIAAGAFAGDGRLLGFVYGLTGVRPAGPAGIRQSPAAGEAGATAGPAIGVDAAGTVAAAPRLLHWSHMLAVAPEARDLRLGTRLKLFQRELLLALGVEEMEWTYDPLEARNAHLNFNLLGVEAVEYVEDMYKGEMGSELARGLGTDRFIVLWRLAGERARAAAARAAGDRSSAPGGEPAGTVAAAGGAVGGGATVGGGEAGGVLASGTEAGGDETASGIADPAVLQSPAAVAAARFAAAPIVDPAPADELGAAGAGDRRAAALPEAPRVRIEVPARIQDFKDQQPERALAYRHGTRRAFEAYLARGYRVTSFYRDHDGRCYYGVEA